MPRRATRSPSISWAVYDNSGRIVARYFSQYEAKAHAQRLGYPAPVVIGR